MRGIDRQGREIPLARELVKHGLREMAEEWCTEELGYRTRTQALEAKRREVSEMRYTSLDRIIARADSATAEDSHFAVTCQGGGRMHFVLARLTVLVGRKTSGNVLGSTMLNVGSGYRVYLPIFGWYSPDGTYLERSGVDPDVTVDIDRNELACGQDAQLNKAIEVLGHQLSGSA